MIRLDEEHLFCDHQRVSLSVLIRLWIILVPVTNEVMPTADFDSNVQVDLHQFEERKWRILKPGRILVSTLVADIRKRLSKFPPSTPKEFTPSELTKKFKVLHCFGGSKKSVVSANSRIPPNRRIVALVNILLKAGIIEVVSKDGKGKYKFT